ncbi:hypothetical protein HYPSUDRAFT_207941 [Hypholoma sublateritium FD-334 SS-4]|uniref:Uncharacterized protein n=1 Tax=Hypholoma sublateritium (strain FD-334 SS-4) TaxID=945553 RepID=A0A0D2N8C4_HYPSF|nr:hypothetical protein HYPSUDRAFT_207941 [Hypholoma sublateritium FD-334 SS-4]
MGNGSDYGPVQAFPVTAAHSLARHEWSFTIVAARASQNDAPSPRSTASAHRYAQDPRALHRHGVCVTTVEVPLSRRLPGLIAGAVFNLGGPCGVTVCPPTSLRSAWERRRVTPYFLRPLFSIRLVNISATVLVMSFYMTPLTLDIFRNRSKLVHPSSRRYTPCSSNAFQPARRPQR